MIIVPGASKEWLDRVERYMAGLQILTKEYTAAENLLDYGQNSKPRAWSRLYIPIQLAMNRNAQLTREYKKLRPTDTFFLRAAQFNIDYLKPSTSLLLTMLNNTNAAYRRERVDDAAWWNTVGGYFIDEGKEALTALFDLILEMDDNLRTILDLIKRWGPPVIIVGGGLLLLNLLARLGVKVRSK